MSIEKLSFVLDGLLDVDALVNVQLRAALDAKVAELKRIDLPLKKFKSISASIHQINLSDDANCSLAMGVDFSAELES